MRGSLELNISGNLQSIPGCGSGIGKAWLMPFGGAGSLLGLLAVLLFGSAPRNAQAQLVATGVVRAQQVVVVKSEVTGIVRRIAVKEGQQVREGHPLVEMKSDRQQLGVELARAKLARARAAVVASRVALENKQKELARDKIAADALPRKEVEDAADEVLRLQAMLDVQEAELEEARGELDLRQNELKEMQLLAPFAGAVTNIRVHKGDALTPLETQVLDLVDLDRLYVDLVLPVEAILKVKEGDRVGVQVEDKVLGRSGRVVGKVSYVNPTVDPSSRTFVVKVFISDPKRIIRPGMLAEVTFGVLKK